MSKNLLSAEVLTKADCPPSHKATEINDRRR